MGKPLTFRPSFFKIMLPGFETQLRIPPAFKKFTKGKLGAFVDLKDANGHKWSVEVETRAPHGNKFLVRGWQSFLEAHSIVAGDLLIFYYDGGSGFTVRAYGAHACEKNLIRLPKSSDKLQGKIKLRRTKKPMSDKLEGKFKWRKTEKPRNHDHSGKKLEGKYKRRKTEKPRDHDHTSDKLEGKLKRKRAAAARLLNLANPYFVVTFGVAYVNHFAIPVRLVKKYVFHKRKSTTLEDPSGTIWPLRLCNRADGRVDCSTGWTDFHRANHMRYGDLCVFEILQGGKLLKVKIIRKDKETTQQSKEPDGCWWQDGEGRVHHVRPKKKVHLMKDDIQMKVLTTCSGKRGQKKNESTTVVGAQGQCGESSGGKRHEKQNNISIVDREEGQGAGRSIPDIHCQRKRKFPTYDCGERHQKQNNISIVDREEGQGAGRSIPDIHCQRKREFPTYDCGEGIENGKRSLPDVHRQRKISLRNRDVQMKGITPISNCGLHHAAVATSKETSVQFAHFFRSFHCNVTVPRAIVKKLHLKSRRRINLHVPSGKSWPIRFVERSNGNIDLGGAWYGHAKRMGITPGDTYNFEFNGDGNLLMLKAP